MSCMLVVDSSIFASHINCRYLRPGTPYFVITVEGCLAIHSHFYCPTTMRATAEAMAMEHLLGKLATNLKHQEAPILLMKTLQNYQELACELDSLGQ